MSNHLAPPNYTQIPNTVFDYWMPRLNPGAFKLLICICRKTFGWHKTSDSISKNQIMKCTGMSKNTVQSAIIELETNGLLEKIKTQNEYGHQPNTYRLILEKPADEIYSNDGQELGGGRSKFDPGGRSKIDPTKERPNKRKTNKKK